MAARTGCCLSATTPRSARGYGLAVLAFAQRAVNGGAPGARKNYELVVKTRTAPFRQSDTSTELTQTTFDTLGSWGWDYTLASTKSTLSHI